MFLVSIILLASVANAASARARDPIPFALPNQGVECMHRLSGATGLSVFIAFPFGEAARPSPGAEFVQVAVVHRLRLNRSEPARELGKFPVIAMTGPNPEFPFRFRGWKFDLVLSPANRFGFRKGHVRMSTSDGNYEVDMSCYSRGVAF